MGPCPDGYTFYASERALDGEERRNGSLDCSDRRLSGWIGSDGTRHGFDGRRSTNFRHYSCTATHASGSRLVFRHHRVTPIAYPTPAPLPLVTSSSS